MLKDVVLMHYSKKRIERVVSIYQCRIPQCKPRGLWISVEKNEPGWICWKQYCENSGTRSSGEDFIICYNVIMTSGANIKIISSEEDLEKFHRQYARAIPPVETRGDIFLIDWNLVSKDHQGVMIAPYLWSMCNSHINWYYNWDCASGCIWDASAIERIYEIVDFKQPNFSHHLQESESVALDIARHLLSQDRPS